MNSFLMGDLLKLIAFYYVSARNCQAARKTSGQMLLEEGDRPLPRQLCRRLVVARRRVVVKAVLRPRILVHLVRNAGRFQRGLEGRPHRDRKSTRLNSSHI